VKLSAPIGALFRFFAIAVAGRGPESEFIMPAAEAVLRNMPQEQDRAAAPLSQEGDN
jgi:hypothetical protein